jgi:hypothetical protein
MLASVMLAMAHVAFLLNALNVVFINPIPIMVWLGKLLKLLTLLTLLTLLNLLNLLTLLMVLALLDVCVLFFR